MRPLVQYDLDDPPTVHSAESLSIGPQPDAAREPPAKKRKRNHQKVFVQHWDDPGSNAVGMVYDDEGDSSMAAGSASMSFADGAADEDHAKEVAEGADEEESRLLTQKEIWDDSALIDAWNSAQAEYEAYHGTSKAWKTEPVKKSPLWYNKPYTPTPGPTARSKHDPSLGQAQEEEGELDPDSAPLNFDTYVPTHDPSLAMPSAPSNGAGANTAAFFVPPAPTATVSRDEAFKNALNAMYWTGYWTAVYHCQSQADTGLAEADEQDEIEADKGDEENDLVPAQR